MCTFPSSASQVTSYTHISIPFLSLLVYLTKIHHIIVVYIPFSSCIHMPLPSLTRDLTTTHESQYVFFFCLSREGYLTMTPAPKKFRCRLVEHSYRVDSELIDSFDSFPNVVPYIRMILQSHLIHTSTLLNQVSGSTLRFGFSDPLTTIITL